MPKQCEYVFCGYELGRSGVNLGDPPANLMVPGRFYFFVRLLHSGQEFLGQANALFWRQRAGLRGEFFDEVCHRGPFAKTQVYARSMLCLRSESPLWGP